MMGFKKEKESCLCDEYDNVVWECNDFLKYNYRFTWEAT